MGITGINWDPQRDVRTLAIVRSEPTAIFPDTGDGTGVNKGPTHAPGMITAKRSTAVRVNDIVGFGESGVWVATTKADGTFGPPRLACANFGVQQGWQVAEHIRLVADVTGTGRGDIVGFGDAGVWIAMSHGDGTFDPPTFALAGFGVQQDWVVGAHPRFVVDLTGDGRGDIVGFSDAGVWTATSSASGGFNPPALVIDSFGAQQGWQISKHVRLMADITGNGRSDIVGFGDAGVWTALSNGDGSFAAPAFVIENFGVQQGWHVGTHPRLVADITGDKLGDIVGFGNAGVWTALSNGDGTFAAPAFVIENFGVQQGWKADLHPRMVADLTGDGRGDIIGFGDAGVWTALSNGDGTFAAPAFVIENFGVQQNWHADTNPRMVVDVTGNGRADIVGFGGAGVWVALSNGDGTFQTPVLALTDFGSVSGTAGIKHIFVLMLENRAYDHMLGFSPISGNDAVTGEPTTTVRLAGTESNVAGTTTLTVTAGADDVMQIDPGHEFEDVLTQLAGPGATYPPGGAYPHIANTGFAAAFAGDGGSPADIMKCYRPDQLPVLNQLATEFAVCDNWFASLPGPTYPNRFFTHAASSGGLDHSPSDREVAWWETADGYNFPKGTMYDALSKAGLQYRFYACDDLPVVAGLAGVNLLDIHDFHDHFAADLGNSDYANLRYVLLEPSYDVFNSYRSGNSQHPSGDVQQGELFLKQAYEAIRNSPLWDDSLLIITWDEHGGFYDHVVPPAAVPPNDGSSADYNQHGFTFAQLGPRVPAVIVSPRIPKNVIDHRVYDHASIPAAAERVLGFAPLTDRDRLVNAPNSLLTLAAPRTDTPATLDADPLLAPTPISPGPTPAELARPIEDTTVVPFLQTAIIQDLKMADASQRSLILAQAKTLRTYGQALDYMRIVATRANTLRTEAVVVTAPDHPPLGLKPTKLTAGAGSPSH